MPQTIFPYQCAALGLLLSGLQAMAQAPDAGAIDGYFRTLSYNPQTLLSVNTSSKSSTTVALFRQVYYTVTMDIPRTPASVFGAAVTLADVKGLADANNPTTYVKSVDYGRLIFVKMETNSS